MNYLDRNEFNYAPSQEVVEALKNFDINKLCFYTRIYDEGKKSILSVYLSETYGIDEPQVLLGYGGEDILKQAVHYFLTQEDGNKTMLIPKFSWWYYKSIADEVDGHTLQYPLYEDGNTFKYDFAAMKEMVQRENPKVLLIASPNNPTGNGLTPAELDALLAELPVTTIVLVDEAYASFVSTDTDYIKMLVDKYPNLIISRTLSKFYGLPGLRMGFGFMSKELANFGKYSNKYLGYNRISEDIAIAALKSDAHYRNIARLMNESRACFEAEIGTLPGFKVYESVANFVLIKYPIVLKERLQKAFADEDYKVKFMNEPDINTHLRITLGRPEQNRIVIDTIKKIAPTHDEYGPFFFRTWIFQFFIEGFANWDSRGVNNISRHIMGFQFTRQILGRDAVHIQMFVHPELMNIKVGNNSEKRGINVPFLLQQIGCTGRKRMGKQQGIRFQDGNQPLHPLSETPGKKTLKRCS